MIRTVIIEDEEDSRDLLLFMLERYCQDVEVIGTAQSVDDAVHLIDIMQPDLVFLDIEIDGGNSFDILNRIDFRKISIIFATAYDHFALKAIKYSAVDYLLKPINFEELIDAVRKYRVYKAFELDERNEALKTNGFLKKSFEYLIIPSVKGFKVYKTSDIIWMRSEKSYTTFKIVNDFVVASKPIGYFEELLPVTQFYRIHNQIVVNVTYIKEYHKGKNGIVVLSNGEELTVSDRRKDGLVKLLSS